jgi:hypothetical protein
MSNKNNTVDTEAAKAAELVEAFDPKQLQHLMATAQDLINDRIKEAKEDGDFKELSSKEKEEKLQEIRIDALTELLVGQIEKKKRFVHYDRAGYWGNMFLQSLMTISTGVAVAGIAMKFGGKSADTDADSLDVVGTAEPANPFQTTATERPIKAAREFKAS